MIFGPFPGGRAAMGLLVVRLIFGIGIILHGWDKVANGGPFQWADGFGPPLSDIRPGLRAMATFTEIGTRMAMILGLFTPLAMLGLAITMTVALVQGHRGEPYVSLDRPYKPTYEAVAHYGIVALGLLLTGPGKVSLDYLLFGRREAGTPVVP